MDLFRFRSLPNQPLRDGQLIPRWPGDSITWVERYREPGEVTIEVDLASGLRSVLPVGTFVSHMDTRALMRIEDHEITDDTIKITGRSFEKGLLDNRVTGSNINFPTLAEAIEYVLPEAATHIQARNLIREHTEATELIDDRDAVPYLETVTTVLSGGTVEERKVAAGLAHVRVLEILAVDDLGLKTLRPAVNGTTVYIEVYKGTDRSTTVVMSMERGEVVNTAYLESERSLKNCALITSKFCVTRVHDTSKAGLERRWMVVDASDLDDHRETIPPLGSQRNDLIRRMQTRGNQALAKQKKIEITKAEASRDVDPTAIFRKHYHIGDLVMVRGGYGAATKMRVTEHVEIEDENGFTSYPTLELPEEAA